MPYFELRHRLKQSVRMSIFDNRKNWPESELHKEWIALSDKLFSVYATRCANPRPTPRGVREPMR